MTELERLEKIVRHHAATLRMNGANTSPALKRMVAEAVAAYETAVASQPALTP